MLERKPEAAGKAGDRISEGELSQIEALLDVGISPSPAQCEAMAREIRRLWSEAEGRA